MPNARFTCLGWIFCLTQTQDLNALFTGDNEVKEKYSNMDFPIFSACDSFFQLSHEQNAQRVVKMIIICIGVLMVSPSLYVNVICFITCKLSVFTHFDIYSNPISGN